MHLHKSNSDHQARVLIFHFYQNKGVQNQFLSRSNQLAEQRREAKLKKSRILRAEDDQTIQRTQELLDILEEGPDLLMAFDGALFSELVEKITIQNNSTAIFRLINGLEIPFERRK